MWSKCRPDSGPFYAQESQRTSEIIERMSGNSSVLPTQVSETLQLLIELKQLRDRDCLTSALKHHPGSTYLHGSCLVSPFEALGRSGTSGRPRMGVRYEDPVAIPQNKTLSLTSSNNSCLRFKSDHPSSYPICWNAVHFELLVHL